MRSPRELAFRARQEAADLWMWISPPQLGKPAPQTNLLPAPAAIAARLQGSAYAAEVVRLAEEVIAHRFRLLGLVVDLGEEIDWRRDWVHQKSTELSYARRIPYLDFQSVGDHKLIWELNRHQHMVLLAQASLLTGREEFLRETERQLSSWWRQNPCLRGINWASALEVAFRTLSWIFMDHLVGVRLNLRDRLGESLYQHGCYLEENLSVYFSPNTHLLGEAVALEALGVLYPGFPSAERWRQTGSRIVEEQLKRQVRSDGSHFEQSSYYHVYALDFFSLHRVFRGASPESDHTLGRMAEYLAALMGPSRVLPRLGDDDGGRLFGLPLGYGCPGRATLATVACMLGRPDVPLRKEDLCEQAIWWLGTGVLDRHVPEDAEHRPQTLSPYAAHFFENSGVAVMSAGDIQVLIDGGSFGAGSAGHSHSDALSLILRTGETEVLIDPGTYTYVGDLHWRNWFRGSAAHNTIRIDGRDQASPVNPFRWERLPEVKVLGWETNSERDYFDGVCIADEFEHRRRVVLVKPGLLLVLDEVQGPPGQHLVEQFWHFARPPQEHDFWFSVAASSVVHEFCRKVVHHSEGSDLLHEPPDGLAAVRSPQLEWSEGQDHGWRSPAFGIKIPVAVARLHGRSELPIRWAAAFGMCNGWKGVPPLSVDVVKEGVLVRAGSITARFLEKTVLLG